jgi:GNAT superfamily N-acetyltransferase
VAVSGPRPRVELLGAQHNRSGFVSGKEALDRYFQSQITQDARRRLAAPFVMVMADGGIGGFYTLSSTALRLLELPEKVVKRLPRYPLVPATLIGRLALDRRYQGQGWGSFLLLDALHRCATSNIASFAVIVDAIDDEARAFYLHAGFLPLPDSPYRLFRRMSDIEALFRPSIPLAHGAAASRKAAGAAVSC